jgi:hypothetical protein
MTNFHTSNSAPTFRAKQLQVYLVYHIYTNKNSRTSREEARLM